MPALVSTAVDGVAIEGYEIRCMARSGVRAQRVLVASDGERVVYAEWCGPDKAWLRRVATPSTTASDPKPKYYVQPGWGRYFTKGRRFTPAQLLYLAAQPDDFVVYDTMEVVPVDADSALSVDNVARGRVERIPGDERHISARETAQEPLPGERFWPARYPLRSGPLGFDVSDLGRVRVHFGTATRYQLGALHAGYRVFRGLMVHVLVKFTFDPLDPARERLFGPGGITVDHMHQDRGDNALANLQYADPHGQVGNRAVSAAETGDQVAERLEAFVERATGRPTERPRVDTALREDGLRFLCPPSDANSNRRAECTRFDAFVDSLRSGGRALDACPHLKESSWRTYLAQLMLYLDGTATAATAFWEGVDGPTRAVVQSVLAALPRATPGYTEPEAMALRDMASDDEERHALQEHMREEPACSCARCAEHRRRTAAYGARMQGSKERLVAYWHYVVQCGEPPADSECWSTPATASPTTP